MGPLLTVGGDLVVVNLNSGDQRPWPVSLEALMRNAYVLDSTSLLALNTVSGPLYTSENSSSSSSSTSTSWWS
jgi:hypothetical protein